MQPLTSTICSPQLFHPGFKPTDFYDPELMELKSQALPELQKQLQIHHDNTVLYEVQDLISRLALDEAFKKSQTIIDPTLKDVMCAQWAKELHEHSRFEHANIFIDAIHDYELRMLIIRDMMEWRAMNGALMSTIDLSKKITNQSDRDQMFWGLADTLIRKHKFTEAVVIKNQIVDMFITSRIAQELSIAMIDLGEIQNGVGIAQTIDDSEIKIAVFEHLVRRLIHARKFKEAIEYINWIVYFLKQTLKKSLANSAETELHNALKNRLESSVSLEIRQLIQKMTATESEAHMTHLLGKIQNRRFMDEAILFLSVIKKK